MSPAIDRGCDRERTCMTSRCHGRAPGCVSSRTSLAAVLLLLMTLVAGCGRELSLTLDLGECDDDRLSLVQVWLFRPKAQGSPFLCRLSGPESIAPASGLELDGLALDPGTTLRVVAIGRRSLSSRECVCVGSGDYAVADGEAHILELARPTSSCSVPLGDDC
jgi:hypothetical protein